MLLSCIALFYTNMLINYYTLLCYVIVCYMQEMSAMSGL